jgi:hypothetical protein
MNPPIEHMISLVRTYIFWRKGVRVDIAFPTDHWNHYLLREAYEIARDYFEGQQ